MSLLSHRVSAVVFKLRAARKRTCVEADSGSGARSTRFDGSRGHAAGPAALGLMLAPVVVVASLLTVGATPAAADACPNAQFRVGPSAALPDCRAWELVSPMNKNGYDAINPSGGGWPSRATTDGGMLEYETPNDILQSGAAGNVTPDTFIGTRTASGWQTANATPPTPDPGPPGGFLTSSDFSPDLSYAVVEIPDESLAPNTPSGVDNLFLQHNGTYSLIDQAPATPACPPGNPFGQLCFQVYDSSTFAGASSDYSHIIFENNDNLTPNAPSGGVNNLYENTDGTIALVGILPDGTVATAGAQPGGGEMAGLTSTFAANGRLQGAISADGSRVFFTAAADGGQPDPAQSGMRELYERVNGASTVEISAPASGATPANSTQEPATYWGASPDGRLVLFTSSAELTSDANTGPAPAIGRANIDGTSPDQSFVPATAAGITVDGSHIYWAEPAENAVGRANLDGTGVDPNFITGASHPQGVAVNGSYIYWTNAGDGVNGDGSIGRANLDGSGVNQSFITGVNNPQGITLDGSYLYWANAGSTFSTRTIGRAALDGTGVNQALLRVNGVGNPGSVAVNASYIYWTDPGTGNVGRANLGGTSPVQAFLTGASKPEGLAVDGSFLYWANHGSSSIGRANLDGTGADESFISNATNTAGLAIDSSHIYWSYNAANTGNELYRYDTGSGTLVDLTPDASDLNGADVLGVVGQSTDGSYVYFVADGQLVSGKGVAGQPNLYLSHAGTVSFIATLSSNDSSDWSAALQDVQAYVTPDGEHLAFMSTMPLTGYDDTDQSTGRRDSEVYEYSAPSGRLVCASCDPTGAAPVGNAFLFGSDNPTSLGASAFYQPRVLSDDGSRLFFSSPDALTPGAGSSYVKVYEYENGSVSLLGAATAGDQSFIDASSSGSDAFIATADQLVPSDRDQLIDVYDARVNGGFASPPSPVACSGDSCQGPPSGSPSLPTAATVSFAGPGNTSSGRSTGRVRVLSRTVRGSSFLVKVRVPSRGRVTIAGSGVRRVSRFARRAGIYRLQVTLTAKMQRLLARKHELKLTLRASYAQPGERARTATFRLTVRPALRHGVKHARRAGIRRRGGAR